MKKLKKEFTLREAKGFTLIELVVVMAIIAVLALLIIGAITVARNTATETTHRSNLHSVQAALEAYYASNRAYPAAGTYSFATITDGAAGHATATLATTSECSGTRAGGGSVIITAAADASGHWYTLTPGTSACTADLTGTNIISGP